MYDELLDEDLDGGDPRLSHRLQFADDVAVITTGHNTMQDPEGHHGQSSRSDNRVVGGQWTKAICLENEVIDAHQ